MDMNEYLVGQMVRHRLAEMRAEAQRHNLAAALAPPRRPLRVVVGQALIGLGRLVLGAAPDSLVTKAS